MASDQKNIDVFNRTANDPELWRLRGLDLHTASEVLRDKALDSMKAVDWENLTVCGAAEANCLKHAGLLFQAAMLQAFAIECLLKCFWILQGNSVAEDGEYRIDNIRRENHELPTIADAVGLVLSDDEGPVLARLSLFGRSLGRYPIAKKWQEQRLSKNEFGVDSGPQWSNEDHSKAEDVLARLKNEIDTRREASGQRLTRVDIHAT